MFRIAWPIPFVWPGKTAVVIGTGPSLSLTQLHVVARAKLDGKCRVFVVNDAVFVAWWADWLHACDKKWWMWHNNTAIKFPGIRTTCDDSVPESWARYLIAQPPKEDGSCGGFAEAPDTVAAGGNGGYQIIQIAAKTGVNRILLLGLDMKAPADGPAHYHGDHPDRIRSNYADTMLPYFPSLAEALKERDIETINCAPGSAIDCFPRAKIEDLL